MANETAKNYLNHLLANVLSSLKLTSYLDNLSIVVPEVSFGDYATNVALVLAKKLKENPKILAKKLIEATIAADGGKIFDKIEERAGFINFYLSQSSLADFAVILAKGEDIKFSNAAGMGLGKKVVFEFSSPNTNKPLHIGHTRNDVYGAACVNLLKAMGLNVVSCEIINDRGIHIMKSMLMYQKYGGGKTSESERIKPDHFVGKFYALFGEKSAESPEKEKELLEEAQALLVKWEAGDIETRRLWEQMNGWWHKGVKQTYEKEGSRFDEVDFESEIYDKGRDLVFKGVKQGVFAKEADGSVSVDLSNGGLDKKILLRKDGTTLYITQDMYLWHWRNERHHPDSAFVTTSSEQSYHFKVLKRIFELLKYPWARNFKHLPYEHVYLGKNKMSSREGNAITADELLDIIKIKVKATMAALEKIKQTSENDELVEQVAFGAIKYGFLKYEPNTRIYFDIDQTISLEGNTGPYIQYAYSRIKSILKKAGEIKQLKPSGLSAPEERQLMRQLLYYDECVKMAAENFKPNLLCNFLYELAGKFSGFYSAVSVLKAESPTIKHQRLTLLLAVSNVLKHGLNLLGIQAPEEM